MSDVEAVEAYLLDDARQFAINRLVSIVRGGKDRHAIAAAGMLLSADLDHIDFPVDLVAGDGVDDEDGWWTPLQNVVEGCERPMCSAIDFEEEVLNPDLGVFLTDRDGSIHSRIYVFSHVNGEPQ